MEFRAAKKRDIKNLVDTIIEAEKSGTERLTYSTLLGISENESRDIIENVLSIEDLDPCELSINSFYIAEENEVFAGACSMWLEGAHEISSAQVKSNALLQYLPISSLMKMRGLKDLSQSMNITHQNNTLQVGVVYVSESFRGRRLASSLIDFAINDLLKKNAEMQKVQVQVFSCNLSAIKAYEKLGFTTIKEITGDENAKNYYPSNKKILMELNLNK